MHICVALKIPTGTSPQETLPVMSYTVYIMETQPYTDRNPSQTHTQGGGYTSPPLILYVCSTDRQPHPPLFMWNSFSSVVLMDQCPWSHPPQSGCTVYDSENRKRHGPLSWPTGQAK